MGHKMAAGTSKSRCVVPPDCNGHGITTMSNDTERSERLCQRFSTVDVVFVLVSLFTYILDLVTDCLLAWQFFSLGHLACGVWTLVLVLVPSLTLQLLSIRWYIAEKRRLCCSWTLLAHIFLLGPVLRYISVLRHGRDAQRSNSPQSYKKLYQAQNDIACLRFIEAYLESAPQLVLQAYFILTVQPLTWVSGLSTSVSLVSLAWAVASYSNALRLAYREAYYTRWAGLVIQALWHMGVVASRVVAIAVFASVYHAWTFLAVGVHWLSMSVWVFIQGPEFFSRSWENKLFSFVLGVVYIFCFLNLKDGPSRHKMWPFYLLLLAENGLLVGLWYREHPSHDTLMIVVTAAVFGGYFLGVLFLLLYYGWCHPGGTISLCREDKSAIPTDHVDDDPQGQEGAYRGRVFDGSLTSAALNPVFSSGYDLSLDSSWSGLVHSRRGDNPTFTTSKYRTSSRQLDFEGNSSQVEPTDVCTRVFDTPHCGPSAPITGLNHRYTKNSKGQGSSSSFSVSSESSSKSPLGCATLADSTELTSFSKASSRLGLDNAGFSVGSLASIPSSRQNISIGHHEQRLSSSALSASLPALSASLPALCIGSVLNQNGDKTFCCTLPRKQSSVYAITGVPKNDTTKYTFNQSSLYNKHLGFEKNTQERNIHQPLRMFEHTQSLQCIPQGKEASTFPPEPIQSVSRNKMRSSCESLSSCSSNLKPRPLSPLNAQALWEESMVRFHKSFDLELSEPDTSGLSDRYQSVLTDRMPRANPDRSDCLEAFPSPDWLQTEVENMSVSPAVTDLDLSHCPVQVDLMTAGNGSRSSLTGILKSAHSTGRLNEQILDSTRAIDEPGVDQSSTSPSLNEKFSPSGQHFPVGSAGSYRTESSGFQSSTIDDSCDFFDYSDDSVYQSKHTLSDLARRLTVSLDLNGYNHSFSSDVQEPRMHVPSHGIHGLGVLPAVYRDTPWREDYQSRIPTPVLRGSLLSLYSASEQSLSVASEINFNTRTSDQGRFIIPGQRSPSQSRPDLPGYKSTICHILDPDPGCLKQTTPLKIYNLAHSPRGRCVRYSDANGERNQSQRNTGIELENYSSSPCRSQHCDTRRSGNPKVSLSQHRNKNLCQRYKSENQREKSSSSSAQNNKRQTPPVRTVDLRIPGNQTMDEKADSFNDSGKHSDVSIRSTLGQHNSWSDLKENVSTNADTSSMSSGTPFSRRTDFLSTTPDFSPIGPSDLPALRVENRLLAPGQSYFSTPKVFVPGHISTSVVTDFDSTDDSFFGVRVPRLSAVYSNRKSSILKRHHASPLAVHDGARSVTGAVQAKHQYSRVKHLSGDCMDSSTSSLSSSVTRQRSPLQTLDMNRHSSGYGNTTQEI